MTMKRETKCIQAGYEPKNGESRMIPIIQSTTFKYDTSEDMGIECHKTVRILYQPVSFASKGFTVVSGYVP